MRISITIYEQECPADDFDSESGQGMPDDTEPVTVDIKILDGKDATEAGIISVLNDFGCGQWDGGGTGYDPDGTHMSPDGIMTERWAHIEYPEN